MPRPKMTREMLFERTMPDCPHCGADMEAARVRLFDLADNATKGGGGTWIVSIDGFVAVDADGYADADKGNVVATCPACERPSVLSLDGLHVKLVAARTALDKRFFERTDPCPAA